MELVFEYIDLGIVVKKKGLVNNSFQKYVVPHGKMIRVFFGFIY